jgi:outer membrane protein assembly factor BamB
MDCTIFFRKPGRLALAVVVLVVLSAGLVWAGSAGTPSNTRGFRGPWYNGIFPSGELMDEWPEGGPEVVWSITRLGRGFSAPTITPDTIYCAGMHGSDGYLYAYEHDGKLKWKKTYGKDFTASGRFQGPRATPTVTEDGKYIVIASGRKPERQIACFTPQGKELWNVELNKRHGGKAQGWGYNESPPVYNGKVFVTLRSKDKQCPPVVALDIKTGETVWKADVEEGNLSAGDGSATIVDTGKRKLLIVPLWRAVLCLDPDTGKKIWRFWIKKGGFSAVYKDGYLFLQNAQTPEERAAGKGIGRGTMMLRLKPDGSYEKLWTSRLGPNYGKTVILDGKVFFFTGEKRGARLVALDRETGKLLKKVSMPGGCATAAADGKLVTLEGGEHRHKNTRLSLIKPTDEGFEIVSQFKPKQGTLEVWTHPVFYRGRMYLRHGDRLTCYDVSAEQ